MYDTIDCPTFSQAFRWFREKYNFCSWVYQVDNGKYFFSILEEGRYLDTNNKKRNSYEEAEKECLKKLIEIVKERK
jgi:TATA-box binding protein (TBP) (component of TFIID and TFIIIB)